jgi:peptidyl-prolyl cis-trans isomerase C
MNRLISRLSGLAVASLAVLTFACTEPPKKERKLEKEELEKIQEGGDSSADSALGAIPDGPVAMVDGEEVTRDQFMAIYDLKLQKYRDRDRKIPRSADRRYRKSITERLIYQRVLDKEGSALGVQHDEAALKEREDNQRKGIKDWEKHLRRRGESEESLRSMYIAELREKSILGQMGKLSVTDEEVDEEYEKVKPNYKQDKERVKASHVLISVGPKERPAPGEKPPEPTEEEKKAWEADALKRANEVFDLANAEGADFAALAREHSDGPSARKGGDLGIFHAERMVKEFSDAAFKLKVNEVSKPVKTKFGFHVIKVSGKYPPGDLPKEALFDQIKERLEARKLHQGKRELKDQLLEKYKVVNKMADHLGPDPKRRRPSRKDRPKDEKAAAKKGAPDPAVDGSAEPKGEGKPKGESPTK